MNKASKLAGTRLGNYYLQKHIGSGGMASVYQAVHKETKQRVAVKVLSPTLTDGMEQIMRFRQEAKMVERLNHPHIIPIYAYGMSNNLLYLVMPMLTGGSLEDWMLAENRSAIALDKIAQVLKAVASALDYAHSMGIVHRDIKLSNIMFDDTGTPFLLDFGMAKLLDGAARITGTGIVLGTPEFMAPEQWLSSNIEPATDQYAMGILAYVLTTGKMPFEGGSASRLMVAHIHEIPSSPHLIRPDLPEALSTVIETAMAKNPKDRFPSVAAFAKMFSRVVKYGDVFASPKVTTDTDGLDVVVDLS